MEIESSIYVVVKGGILSEVGGKYRGGTVEKDGETVVFLFNWQGRRIDE